MMNDLSKFMQNTMGGLFKEGNPDIDSSLNESQLDNYADLLLNQMIHKDVIYEPLVDARANLESLMKQQGYFPQALKQAGGIMKKKKNSGNKEEAVYEEVNETAPGNESLAKDADTTKKTDPDFNPQPNLVNSEIMTETSKSGDHPESPNEDLEDKKESMKAELDKKYKPFTEDENLTEEQKNIRRQYFLISEIIDLVEINENSESPDLKEKIKDKFEGLHELGGLPKELTGDLNFSEIFGDVGESENQDCRVF